MNKFIVATAAFLIMGCSQSDTFTLYRNSVLDEFARIHVASFNAKEPNPYNQGNCDVAKDLFQKQEGIKTKFWCEKGAFKK